MPFRLPALPYALNALAPAISQRTLEFHYQKHHAGYMKKLNDAIKDTDFANKSMEEIVRATKTGGVFNNAAQSWNHAFYWHSMTAKSNKPKSELKDAIDRDFGSLAVLKKAFKQAAMGQFGSGWAWLIADRSGKLSIQTTGNAETPIVKTTARPLLVCDVWEHAYYLDFQNKRDTYVDAFWKLANWNFAAENYAGKSTREFESL